MDREPTYSYRLRISLPMLTDDEYEVIVGKTSPLGEVVKYGERTGASLDEARKVVRPAAMDIYEALTGFRLDYAEWLYCVRRSDYGPACPSCGKPYRTPRARFCAECGHGLPLS